MKILDRHMLGLKLGISASTVSNYVSQKRWDCVPMPVKIRGVFKWLEPHVDMWVKKQFINTNDAVLRIVGRPKKKRGQ